MTIKQKEEVRRLKEEGLSVARIAKKMDVSVGIVLKEMYPNEDFKISDTTAEQWIEWEEIYQAAEQIRKRR